MGKIRTRILGLEEVEKKQKEEQKQKAKEKKKVRAPGLKGGERMVAVEVKEEELNKLKKTEEELKKKVKEKKVKRIKIAGKKYQAFKKMIDKNKNYSLKEAIALLKKMNAFNFTQSVEIHLNIEKSGLKGEVEFPYSIGKRLKVAVVDEEVLKKIEEGEIDFDVLITHPSFMPKLTRFAKILGPRGLMPNPKAGTISSNPEMVAKKFEKGMIRWKSEPKFPLVHQMVGKLTMKEEELEENIKAFLKSVGLGHIKEAYLKATMTPSIRLELKNVKV